jgi:hypothetical protein
MQATLQEALLSMVRQRMIIVASQSPPLITKPPVGLLASAIALRLMVLEATNDYSGVSVSSAGDVNGDGLDDLIVGAYQAELSGKTLIGKSYVVFIQAIAVDIACTGY